MYPTLPFGPISLPTGPILAILAVIVTLDVAGRFGRRYALHPDDVWNVGLIALASGLIVARLWNVFQFWYIYQTEPHLIFSLRPSGFEFWPGVIAALIGGYGYLLARALDPGKVAAALVVGAAAGSVLLGVSGYATGAVLGAVSDAPTALLYFGEYRHPLGLYRAVAGILLMAILWATADRRPVRTVLLGVLGYSLIILVGDAFLANSSEIMGFRVGQVVALSAALAATVFLARLPAAAPLPELPPAAPVEPVEPAPALADQESAPQS